MQFTRHWVSLLSVITAASSPISFQVLLHPRYQQSKRVSIYLSTPKEINTEPILEDLFRTGKAVYIPRFDSKNHVMDMLRLKDMDDFRGLPSTTWNIKQPKLDEERENVLDTGKLSGAALGSHGRFFSSLITCVQSSLTTIIIRHTTYNISRIIHHPYHATQHVSQGLSLFRRSARGFLGTGRNRSLSSSRGA